MERLLAIYIGALCEEAPDGSTLRDYLRLLDALSVLCPFAEPVRLGLYVLPIRGPSRFYGGETAVLETVTATVGYFARPTEIFRSKEMFCPPDIPLSWRA